MKKRINNIGEKEKLHIQNHEKWFFYFFNPEYHIIALATKKKNI